MFKFRKRRDSAGKMVNSFYHTWEIVRIMPEPDGTMVMTLRDNGGAEHVMILNDTDDVEALHDATTQARQGQADIVRPTRHIRS